MDPGCPASAPAVELVALDRAAQAVTRRVNLGGRRWKGSLQRLSELPAVMLQLLGLGPEEPQGCGARVLEHGGLGGQRQALEQAAQVAAATQDLVTHIPLLGLLAQRVHQLLAHRDDQLALRDEDVGGLAGAEAAVKCTDGFEECPEIEPAVFRKVDLPLRAQPAWRSG